MVFEENMAALSFSNWFCPVKKVLKQKSYTSPLWESFKYVKEYSDPSIFNTSARKIYFLEDMFFVMSPATSG
jgi:hypothetical protein